MPYYQDNTYTVPQMVARQGVLSLRDNLVAARLVNIDYSDEFVGVNSVVNASVPATFTANSMIGANTNVQVVSEQSIPVTVDQWWDVSFPLNPKDKALIMGGNQAGMAEVTRRLIQPAIIPLVTKVEDAVLGLYKRIPYYYGTAATTPSSLEAYSNVAGVMFGNQAPDDGNSSMILDNAATIKLRPLLTVLNGGNRQSSGANDALSRAQLSDDIYGLKPFSSQRIATHTKGTLAGSPVASGTAQTTVNRFNPAAVQTISIAGATNGTTLVQGDIITFADDETKYVVRDTIKTAGSDTNIAAVTIWPGLPANMTSKTVTVLGTHTASMAFHRNAFALAVRNLALPESAKAEIMTDPDTGLSVRVVYGYDFTTQADIISIGILFGVACVDPRLACRVIG